MPLTFDLPGHRAATITSLTQSPCIVTAPARLARPIQQTQQHEICPFCEGNESRTPAEVWSDRSIELPANSRGWRVRVVPNRFPILDEENSTHADQLLVGETFAHGRHEVIIERPDHGEDWRGLTTQQVVGILLAYQARLISLSAGDRYVYASLFKNCGALAGASQFHSHAQIIGLPFVPPSIIQEASERSSTHDPRSVRPDLVIHSTDRLFVFCPERSRFPLEAWVMPIQRQNHFSDVSESLLSELANTLLALLSALASMIEPVAYHMVLHTSPFRATPPLLDRWVWQLLPRLENIGGFEWSTGMFVNPLPPDWAAAEYRNRILQNLSPS